MGPPPSLNAETAHLVLEPLLAEVAFELLPLPRKFLDLPHEVTLVDFDASKEHCLPTVVENLNWAGGLAGFRS